MSRKMSNAPVYYALVQAHFNPVAAMAKYVDEVQDRLRRKGYTLFETISDDQFVINVEPGRTPAPQLVKMTQWSFNKSDRSAGFILNNQSITFHTTFYNTRDEFIPELISGLDDVNSVVGLEHLSRLGLRYLDAVLPGEQEELSLYLVEEVHGVKYQAGKGHVLSESSFRTLTGPLAQHGVLVSKVFQMKAALGFPPDLMPAGLKVMPKFEITTPKVHAVIDTDHYVEGQMALDMEKIQAQLENLHSAVKEIFALTVTEHALKVWA